MSKIKYVYSLFLLFLSAAAFGFTPWTQDTFKDMEFSVAGGPNWAQSFNTHLVVSPRETDSVLLNDIDYNPLWKIGMGYYYFADQLRGNTYFNALLVEINLYQSSETLKGNVWQFQLPQFNNYRFEAPVTSTRLMLELKPSLFRVDQVSFFPIVGVGASWNRISFNETVTGRVPASSNYLLRSNTHCSFAYDAGAGIRADFTKHLSASLEYLYSNVGNMTPSNSSKNGNPILAAPAFHVYNQSLLLGLSWKV